MNICPNCRAAHGEAFSGDLARRFCPACGHQWKPPQVLIVGPRPKETPQGRAVRERANDLWIERVERICAKALEPQIGGAA